MHPLFDLSFTREINYITYFSPLKGTSFEEVLSTIKKENNQKICLAGPI